MVEIGPDLGLEDDRELRLHALEETAHRTRQIDGHVAHVDACAEQGLGARATGGRDRGQHQRDVGETLEQRFDERHSPPALRPPTPRAPRCCVIAHRRAEAESLRESPPVDAVAKAAQRQRADPQRRDQIGDADVEEAHAVASDDGRLRQTRGLAITGQQRVPVLVGETLRRGEQRHLLERTIQPDQRGVRPPAALAQRAAIEVDEVDLRRASAGCCAR